MRKLNDFFYSVNYKFLLLAVAGLSLVENAMAQNESTAFNNGITAATNTIVDTFDTVSDLMMVIGAVVGLVGAIQIYTKFQNGDQDVTKRIMMWGGACLFLVGAGAILKAIFLD